MKPPIPVDTKERQAKASRPDLSAWVSANAGSGKTHVLAQRVIRLLLAGTPPSKILCLTYTKAAAANMSLRVFDTLAAWTRLDDATLAKKIADTGADPPDSVTLLRARQLFARTVETPGGLKIQTIHAFCERLLHLYPFEANVAAGFEVMADDQRDELLAAARQQAFAQAVQGEDNASSRWLEILARETSASGLDELIGEALKHRAAIVDALRAHQGAEAWGRALGRKLGLRSNDTAANLERAMTDDGIPPSEWKPVADALDQGSKNDQTLGGKLRTALAAANPADRTAAYLGFFFTQKGEPRGIGKTKIITKTLIKLEPGLLERLEAERDRLALLVDKRKAAHAVERSIALFSIVDRILQHYAQAKGLRGLLDFDDLIERTETLLTRSSAAWVLYKLDAGIDHILVDEAQDTSKGQWNILQAIVEDFMAGHGARQQTRTFFAVGDEKQSIYSFQGASPGMFDRMRRYFQNKMQGADKQFELVRLNLSFRSVPAVLASVDRVFEQPGVFTGVVAEQDQWTLHEAWKDKLPGLVEIWRPVAGTAVDDPESWELPLDRQDYRDPPVILARRIADTIADWQSPGSTEAVHDDETGLLRPIRPGDVLVLVRSRGALFEAVIRALKERGVRVAGADRIALTEHIAVEDLIAAGRASLLPEDDLTLACLLKSPLIGLDDDDLLELAPQRTGTLIEALQASAKPAHRAAAAQLDVWRRRAGALTPFRFYAELLGRDGGRRRMLARLGPEAGDAIDEFQRLALEHERTQAPSLTLFLHRLESADIQIKRDMEAAGDAVRVMTVHAAKGLEAKIVFLPDTFGAASGRHDPKLFDLDPDGQESWLLWGKGSGADPATLADLRTKRRVDEEQEQRRLLYVAMTRAEQRLYIAGCHGSRPPKDCWYNIVQAGLQPHAAETPAAWDAAETVLRLGTGAQIAGPVAPAFASTQPVALPVWLDQPAAFEAAAAPPISPSSALAAADQLDQRLDPAARFETGLALLAGRLTHALLQHLPQIPPERRREAGQRYLAARGGDLAPERRDALLVEALRLIDDPGLADLFGPGSQVEVSIAGRLERPGRKPLDVAGQIDRIVATSDAVLIADFKTGRPRPIADAPETYLAQLALYRAVLQPLYPGRSVRTLLVWTSDPNVLDVEPARLDAALARVLGA